ncbi:GIY-YIG nuclease family protein [Variovorax robiniae]|uniref:GIY-YIG nuclease family protein n=1 Tax=Variovorax robiniae TaxID=1836199 RepID=A0ABU8XDQ7_9BURK
MKITLDFIERGATANRGFTRRHIELLGLQWPPNKGWKRDIVGREIDDEVALEYLALAAPQETALRCQPESSSEIWLYVLALAGGKHYVGITSNMDRRFRQHAEGKAARWTALHPVQGLSYSFNTSTRSSRTAELIEDQATIALMVKHGVDNVRGGHFCSIDPPGIKRELRAHGMWDLVQLARLRRDPGDDSVDWDRDVRQFIAAVVAFHDSDGAPDLEDAVFVAGLKLTRSRYWRASYAPCLGSDFWGRKGVLHVLLSFSLNRSVGSRVKWPFEILAAALNRSRDGHAAFRWLYLTSWELFAPAATDTQEQAGQALLQGDRAERDRDRRFDDFLSVLFPELRHRLRA